MKWKIDQVKKGIVHSIGLDGRNDQSKSPKEDNGQDQSAANHIRHASVRVDVEQEFPYVFPGKEIAVIDGWLTTRASTSPRHWPEFLEYQAAADAFHIA